MISANQLIAEAGKHGFDGNCAPGALGTIRNQDTFSVGIFEWLPKSGGKGCKRSTVKVRVKGCFSDPDKVYAKAREIASLLDEGQYIGPKTVMA